MNEQFVRSEIVNRVDNCSICLYPISSLVANRTVIVRPVFDSQNLQWSLVNSVKHICLNCREILMSQYIDQA